MVQRAGPPPGVSATGRVVVLLHGAAFTSQTWVTACPTLATLAALGHTAVAVDLPGYGDTAGLPSGMVGAVAVTSPSCPVLNCSAQ